VRVNLFVHHASDGRLELAVLGGVDERVDAAVGEHQHDTEMIQPAGEVDNVVDRIHEDKRHAGPSATADSLVFTKKKISDIVQHATNPQQTISDVATALRPALFTLELVAPPA